MIVARCLCRELRVRFSFACIEVDARSELLAYIIIEVVVRAESHRLIVCCAEIFNAFWLYDRVVLACNVVRHEVDDDLHVCFVSALDECVELRTTLIHPYTIRG